ncbi:lanthionine synthetase C family protein [Chitinophaga sp.]|uniref:lanthionine synthetase C family protein n=1 Tax=Chitinophaga sp. TaxID=1869181 RepID=UPI0031D37721
MWTPIAIPGLFLPKITEIRDTIVSALENGYRPSPGVFDGAAGLAIFLSEYDRYHGARENAGIVEMLIEGAFEQIQAEWPTASFCQGVSGLLWATDYLNRYHALDMQFDLDDVAICLLNEMEVLSGMDNFDYLHGADGIWMYLMKRAADIDQDHLNKHLWEIYRQSEKDANGIKWESYVDFRTQEKGYNLSLSHGISARIILLSRMLHSQPDPKLADTLKQAVGFLSSCKNQQPGFRSVFPGYVKAVVQPGNSRLGWCYGDMGNAFALYTAGKALEDHALIAEALSVMRHAAGRRNPEDNSVFDAGLCHGTAGIAHMFNRMYQSAGGEEFRDAALYWYTQTLDHAVFTDGLSGYKKYDAERGWQNEYAMLEGIAGIGLSLLAGIDSHNPAWDESLLLS